MSLTKCKFAQQTNQIGICRFGRPVKCAYEKRPTLHMGSSTTLHANLNRAHRTTYYLTSDQLFRLYAVSQSRYCIILLI